MKVLVKDQLVEYADEGSGRVILMMHGWGMNLTTFDQLSKHLTKKFRVIRLDFPGFGHSPRPADDWSVGDYAVFINEFLKKLKINKVYAVIGHSFGGKVIIKGISCGLISPEKVALISTAGVKPRQKIRKISFKYVAKSGKFVTSIPVLKKIQPTLRRHLYDVAGSDYLMDDKMKKIFKNVVKEDLLTEVPKIIQPSLLLWGSDDTETPLNDARLILDYLPHGRLVVVPGTGHFVYIEAFDRIAAELDDFLL